MASASYTDYAPLILPVLGYYLETLNLKGALRNLLLSELIM